MCTPEDVANCEASGGCPIDSSGTGSYPPSMGKIEITPMPKHKKCRMCGHTYFHYSKPPCTVMFFGEEFYADLCYSCGARLVQFIKSFRQKDRWKNMVV